LPSIVFARYMAKSALPISSMPFAPSWGYSAMPKLAPIGILCPSINRAFAIAECSVRPIPLRLPAAGDRLGVRKIRHPQSALDIRLGLMRH
jgi:hypothetical protein